MRLELTGFKDDHIKYADTNSIYLNHKNKIQTKFAKINDYVFKIVYKKWVGIDYIVTNNYNRVQIGSTYGNKVEINPFRGELIKDIEKINIHIEPRNKNDQLNIPPISELLAGLDQNYMSKKQDFIVGNLKIHVRSIYTKCDTDNSCDKNQNCVEVTTGLFKLSTSKVKTSHNGTQIKTVYNMNANKARNKDFNVNLNLYGIGGMNKEFNNLIQLLYSSRLIDPSTFKKMGIRHKKGVIIYGPSGVGKTSIARIIGNVLNIKNVKVVNGPEILNKYVGQSEANIRTLFKEAETEFKLKGIYSDVHLIIFDEIDAITRKRNFIANGGNQVGHNVVNQLLTKMDGIDKLDNIIVIGTTNCFETIDEAMLRPGRFGIHIEVPLPDTGGRKEIFDIHTKGFYQLNIMGKSVDLNQLAELTTNYTGAEIEDVVQNAFAIATGIQNIASVKIEHEHFVQAILYAKPTFGRCLNDFIFGNQFVLYNKLYSDMISELTIIIKQFMENTYLNRMAILIEGVRGSGKTTLSSHLVIQHPFEFAKKISPCDLISLAGENVKSTHIQKIFSNSNKSQSSVILLDDIEKIIECTYFGTSHNNTYSVSKVLQHTISTLITQPPKSNKRLIIGTSSSLQLLKELRIDDCFDTTFTIPLIHKNDVPNIKKLMDITDDTIIDYVPTNFTIMDFFAIINSQKNTNTFDSAYKIYFKHSSRKLSQMLT